VADINPLWDEYILWERTAPANRGAVATQAEWAASKGISDRAVRKWKANPRFQEREAELAKSFAAQVKAVAVVDGEVVFAEGGADEADYRMVRQQLIEGAKAGNQKSIEMYFRTYGKSFVDEETAARSSNLANEDLESLVTRAMLAVGPELVAAALREQGWSVTGPVLDEADGVVA
jgi:hypothetical protein